jgi:serine/threonine-protein kinase
VQGSAKSRDAETVSADTATSGPSSAKAAAFENGSVISEKYLVEERIAEGGIGIVVMARHLGLNQRVAIKYLKPKTLSNRRIVERFEREARLAAQVTSEHVVRVHDVGTLADAGPYMVMEFLVGEDLGKIVQDGPLPMGTAVDYVLQVCDGLADAHAHRIVHRDIKPENLFLAQRAGAAPVLKIIDFGISKVQPRRDEKGRVAAETEMGERFGTPLYMSPEQLRSTSKVDRRTDIWSLGVVLHELLTGALPFHGDELPQVCTSVLTGEPIPLRAALPDAPAELEAIILKCLEKDPADRFADVAALARRLAPFASPGAETRVARIAELLRGLDSTRPVLPEARWPAGKRARRVVAETETRAVATVTLPREKGPAERTRPWFVALAALVCAAAFVALVRHAPHKGGAAVVQAGAGPGPAAQLAPAAIGPVPALPSAEPEDGLTTIRADDLPRAPPIRAKAPAARPHPALQVLAPPAVAPSASAPPAPTGRRAQFGERE